MNTSNTNKGKSELCCLLTAELFEKIYTRFIEQAEENAITKKAYGCRTPYGITFSGENKLIDGGTFSQHFGQGAASKTPYINWHVVSIYYIVESSRIVLGIEEDRYPYLKRMKPIKSEQIGNKKTKVSVFYESTKESVDFGSLYECFIRVSEEVMKIGMK